MQIEPQELMEFQLRYIRCSRENLYQFSQSSSIISLPLAVFHKDGQPELSPLYIKEGQEMNPQTTVE